MLCNKKEHYRALSSSHANKRRLHTHALPPSVHPKLHISSTEHSLQTTRSKRRDNLNLKGISPTQLSYQKKYYANYQLRYRGYHRTTSPHPSPTPSQTLLIVLHQREPHLPPYFNRPPTRHNELSTHDTTTPSSHSPFSSTTSTTKIN